MGPNGYRRRRYLPASNLTMPCQGCVGWMGQQTGTYTKYWCPADSTFHFDWEPCVAAPTPAPTPTGGPTPGTSLTLTPSSGMAPIAGVSAGGCGSCRRGCVSAPVVPLGTVGAALTVATTTTGAPCPCQNGSVRRALPWWVWVLGALGAISVVRRVVRG
jgi:hypothetical protein